MSNKTYKQYQEKIFQFMKTQRAQRWFDKGWGESMSSKINQLVHPVKNIKTPHTDFFVFTEIFQCGKVGVVAIESFIKHHSNQMVHVYGVPRDFEWISSGGQIVFHDISFDSKITHGYDKGHLGTAQLWAKLIKERPEKYLIHFDSDVIFRREALSDITNRLHEDYDLVGPVRNYKNNPNNKDNVRHLPDVCQTLFFGFNRQKVGKFNQETLVRMCRGSFNPLGHPVIDFFDPVMFTILHNGGKIFHLSANDYGGYNKSGKRAKNKYTQQNKIIDFGDKLVHFSAVGSGMNFYNNAGQIKEVPESYLNYAKEKYALFCRLFYNETINWPVDKRSYSLLAKSLKS